MHVYVNCLFLNDSNREWAKLVVMFLRCYRLETVNYKNDKVFASSIDKDIQGIIKRILIVLS